MGILVEMGRTLITLKTLFMKIKNLQLKNKTTTKTKGPRKNTTPRKKITSVSTLKSDPIKKVQPKKVTIPTTLKKDRPQKIKDIQARNNIRSLIERADARESQPLAPSPHIPNRRSYRSRR